MTTQTLSLFFLVTFLPTLTTTALISSADIDFIRRSCATTQHPQICFDSLSPYADTVHQNPNRLVRTAIDVSLSRARLEARNFSSLSKEAELQHGAAASAALHDCVSVFKTAVELQRRSLDQMARLSDRCSGSFRFQMSSIQTWMSAALTNEETCKDGFDGVAVGPIKTQVLDHVLRVEAVTSDALSLVNAYATREEYQI